MARRPGRRLATPVLVLIVANAAAWRQPDPAPEPSEPQQTETETRDGTEAPGGAVAPPVADPSPVQTEPAADEPNADAPAGKESPEAGPDQVAPPESESGDDEPREAEVYFFDGRRIRGQLVSIDDERMVLSIRGIETPFSRKDIAYHRVFPPPSEQYKDLRASIRDQDSAQLLRLAEWCIEHGLYEEALQDLGTALTFDPGNTRALELQITAAQLIALRVKTDDEKEEEEKAPDKPRRKMALLSADQVNLIKIYEVNLNDPPPISIDADAIGRFIDAYSQDNLIPSGRAARVAMMRKPPAELLELAFRLRARDFYNEFKVLGEPDSMNRFRTNVHAGWLMNGCATAACHGGESAGRLWLATDRPRAERTVYTNFLILDRSTLDDGTPLLNWDKPEESPLLQMTLPREKSLFPHPRVVMRGNEKDWRPVFGSTDDRGFKRAVDWMKSMYRPRPKYPIDYEPPVPAGFIPKPPEPEGPVER